MFLTSEEGRDELAELGGLSKSTAGVVTTTLRLIRCKGVGIFFVTQTPKDVPVDVLGQPANRIQQALRAFTPEEVTALKATVSTIPVSAKVLEETLTSAGIGEAVVAVMNEKGAPTPVGLPGCVPGIGHGSQYGRPRQKHRSRPRPAG